MISTFLLDGVPLFITGLLKCIFVILFVWGITSLFKLVGKSKQDNKK